MRCLPDGRVLIATQELRLPEFHLPSSERSIRLNPLQLFVLDGARHDSPSLLSFNQIPLLRVIEVSPDAKQVLAEGVMEVLVLTLASGRVERYAQGDLFGSTLPATAWRAVGEFTYARKQGGRYELVLHRGDSDTVLSRNWPWEILNDD